MPAWSWWILAAVCWLLLVSMVPSFRRGGLYGGLLPLAWLVASGLTVQAAIT